MDAPHNYPNSVHTRDGAHDNQILCRNFWSSGHCPYGDKCKFVHLSDDNYGSSVSSSSGWQERGRSGNVNIELNPTNVSNPQRTLCNYFSRGRHCPYDRCIFLHQRTHASEEKREVLPRKNASICIQPVDDRDTANRRSSYQVKTRLCNSWMRDNTCHYGDKCTYAHGRAELRRGFQPPEHRNPSTSRTTQKHDPVHKSAERPVPAVQKSPPEPKPFPLRWNNRKVVGIYGDWIDEDSLNPSSSEKQQ
ncbi:hypothetical protein vseg_013006 [Gypsophila vaccaria]